ncbi:MAG: lysophospholipid acyltransferase family protein [Myxococcota bacterium]
MIAALLGVIWWWLIPIRRDKAIENFKRCFPSLPVGPNLRRSVGEMALQFPELALGARCTIDGIDAVRGGGLILGGHFGAWEILLVSLADAVPVTIFIREPSSPLAARLIRRLRSQARDLELLTPSDSPRRAYRALEAGRVVMLVQDQRYNRGISTTFFGRPCKTAISFAALAHFSGAPLFGVSQWRDGRQHKARIEPLDWDVPDDRRDAIRVLTEKSQTFYEAKIRVRPHSWLWLHDRWRDGEESDPKRPR